MKREKTQKRERFFPAVLIFCLAVFIYVGYADTNAYQEKYGCEDGLVDQLNRAITKGYCTYDEAISDINSAAIVNGFTQEYLTSTVIPGHYLTAATIDTLIANGMIPAEYDGQGYDELGITPSLGGKGGGSTTPSTPKGEEKPKAEHKHSYKKEVTKPMTCTENGEITYTCSCGDSYTEQILAPGHDYEETKRVEAVCEIDGRIEYTCKECGDIQYETIPSVEHEFVLTEEKKPLCMKDGCKTYTCKNCGEVRQEIIEQEGHLDPQWEVSQENGFFTKGVEKLICSVCGQTLEKREIPAKHNVYLFAGVAGGVLVLAAVVVLIVKAVKKKRK